jgi:hypothetical protein
METHGEVRVVAFAPVEMQVSIRRLLASIGVEVEFISHAVKLSHLVRQSSYQVALQPASLPMPAGGLCGENCPCCIPDRLFWSTLTRKVSSFGLTFWTNKRVEVPMRKIDPKYLDLPASKYYDYGYKEGLPRLLEVCDRRYIKVTSV